jgi:hypothetical protein
LEDCEWNDWLAKFRFSCISLARQTLDCAMRGKGDVIRPTPHHLASRPSKILFRSNGSSLRAANCRTHNLPDCHGNPMTDRFHGNRSCIFLERTGYSDIHGNRSCIFLERTGYSDIHGNRSCIFLERTGYSRSSLFITYRISIQRKEVL